MSPLVLAATKTLGLFFLCYAVYKYNYRTFESILFKQEHERTSCSCYLDKDAA